VSDAQYPWRRPPRSPVSGDRDASDFGYAMERLREHCGWARAEVAERSGSLAYSTVAGIENGHRPPSKRTLGPLALGLGVDHHDLEEFWQLVVARAPDDTLDSAWRSLLAEAEAGEQHARPMAERQMASPRAFQSRQARGPRPGAPRGYGWPGADPFGDDIDDDLEFDSLGELAAPLMVRLGGDINREMPLVAALEDEPSSTSHRDALARELHALASRLPQDDLTTAVQVLRGLVAKAREAGTLHEQ
jgi:transcriptional regulator with XRE-family HTH domain